MIDTYGECDHENPEEDEKYLECIDSPSPHESCWDQRVKCRHFTEFAKAMEEYENLHDDGAGLDGDHVTLCYELPMGRHCQECSHEQGRWVGHIKPEHEKENDHEQ